MPPNARTLLAVVCSVALLVPTQGAAVAALAGVGPPPGGAESVEWADDPDDLEGTVVVRLDPYDPAADRGREATVAALQAHADRTQEAVLAWAEDAEGVEVRSRFWLVNAVTLSVDDDADLAALSEVATVEAVHESFEVTRAGPVRSTASAGAAADREVTDGLALIDVPAARERFGATGEGATVAVLDTGVAADHPDLDVAAYREFDGSGDPVDVPPTDHSPRGHGTHAAGTVAGENDSGTAIGVAPDADLAVGAVLTDCRVGGCSGTFEQIVAGMEWAVAEAEADVLSMSLGIGGRADRLVEPVRNARAAGTVVVAAAGNAGSGSSGSPGNVYETVAVGAVDDAGAVAGFSGGERVARDSWSDPPEDWPDEYVVPTVTAPGVDVYSAEPGGYGEKSGTSMATPHVAGVAALVAAEAEAGPEEIEDAIESTAQKPADAPGPPDERDTRYGAGVVDAAAAVEAALREEPIPAVLAERTVDALTEWDAGAPAPGDGGDGAVAGLELGRRE